MCFKDQGLKFIRLEQKKMNKRLSQLSEEIQGLEKISKQNLKKERKLLKEVRKTHPLRMDPDIYVQNGCLHEGSTFIVPVQNWKKGTVFEKKDKVEKKTHNVHSAKIIRNVDAYLKEDEMDYIMEHRKKLAENMIPIHHPQYELVPTTIEPIQKSHKKIWETVV